MRHVLCLLLQMLVMKYVLAFLLSIPLFAAAQEDRITVADQSWHLDYETALKEARKTNKNLLVYFTGSDWCAPCKMLKKDLFETAEFKEASEDYVMLYIDIPRNKDLLSSEQLEHNKALLPRFNTRNVFPLFTVLSIKEKKLDQLSGYNMKGEIRYHLDFIRKNR